MSFPRASWSNLLASSPLIVPGVSDGTNVRAVIAPSNVGDSNPLQVGLPAALYVWNGGSFDRARATSATELAAATKQFAQMVSGPGQWAQFNAPAANTQATTTKAAGGAGVRHVCQAIVATLINTAATGGTPDVVLRDGTSGAGTILFQASLAITATAAGAFAVIALSGLNIFGTANTAMTFEFGTAGGVTTVERVNMMGYSTI